MSAATEPWPPVLVPTDRPRHPGTPARCSAVVSADRAGFGAAGPDVLLAGFAAVLHRYTGQERIRVTGRTGPVGFVVTGRSRLRELRGHPAPGPAGGELRLAVRPDSVALHYDSTLFDRATALRLLDHVRTLVCDAERHPDRPVARLRLLADADAHRMLVEWNATATGPLPSACLHEAFQERAAQAPDTVAAVHGGRHWTYRRVNASANRLAHHLRALGVGPDVPVGLCLDRSPDLLVAALAVLKAGGAFVPIDPACPKARVAAMVAGTSCAVTVSRADLAANLPAGPVVLLDRDAAELAGRPAHDPGPVAGPDDLCYVIHTSGSTGVPKPIALCHRGVVNNIADINSRFGVGPGDSVLALSSPSFDMSVYEFLGVTAAGGTVVVPAGADAGDPQGWARLLRDARVTLWNSAPALLGLLVDHLERAGRAGCLPDLRLALLGGDWVPVTLPDRIRAFAPGLRFVALGGATEASIHSTVYEVERTDPEWASIPYGRPMANQRTYIVDDAMQPVPPGVPGELYLAGVGLARGYVGQPDRTAERFVEWSYGEVTGERLYRTGDRARFGPDGLIELLGRTDFQVKINGMRVEPGEVEAALRGLPGVRQAVVVARGGRLVGYVVADPSTGPDDLLAALGKRLPEYLVPAVIVPLAELPLTPNGKVDRRGLPDPPPVGTAYRAPETAAERILAEVWADVLGVPRVGADDDFVALGGDSVRAIQVVSRARSRGVGTTAADVLRLRTVAAIARTSSSQTATDPGTPTAGPLVAVGDADLATLAERCPGLADVWPLTPMQSGMLFESMVNDAESDTYQLQTVYHLSGPVDADRLRAAGRALLDRHPALRAGFVTDLLDTPVQVVVAAGVEPAWREIELPGADPDGAFRDFLAADRAARFDLARPPLVRMSLARYGPERAALVLTTHHALLDGWSEQLLANELVRLAAGLPLDPVPGFGGFLRWLSDRDTTAGVAAWAAELAGLAGPTLLAPDAATRRRAVRIEEHAVPLAPGELVPPATLGGTASTFVRAAWAVTLAGLTGHDDVVFGATVAGRPGELAGVESTVGLFINTVPVRVRLSPQQTVGELVADLLRGQTALLDHQHVGLTEIRGALGVDDRLFDTMVAFQSFPTSRPAGAGVGITGVESLGRGSFPLTLIVEPRRNRLTVQYDRGLFDRAEVATISDRFRAVARRLAADPAAGIGALIGSPAAVGPVAAAPPPAVGYRQGRTERETALCTLVAEVLGVPRVGIDDDFFALGCDSLKATRLIGRMRRTLGIEASIRTVFQYSSVAKLSGQLTTSNRPALGRRTSG